MRAQTELENSGPKIRSPTCSDQVRCPTKGLHLWISIKPKFHIHRAFSINQFITIPSIPIPRNKHSNPLAPFLSSVKEISSLQDDRQRADVSIYTDEEYLAVKLILWTASLQSSPTVSR